MKNCFLVLAHKRVDYICFLAKKYNEANFYIHLDRKVDINKIKNIFFDVHNVYFISNRVDINWAGFSMVEATLNLLRFALSHDKSNQCFHLISGDDIFLNMPVSWEEGVIYMECKESLEHRYRVRFNTPHADTRYMRSFFGKILTQFYKLLDAIIPTQEKFYFGSQWFSIHRTELEILIQSITQKDIDFFKNKLCPDEHFFQYLVVKNKMLNKVSIEGNKRYIFFDKKYQRGSSPIFLNLEQLEYARDKQNWFARKVEAEVMSEFYNLKCDK